MRLFSTASNAWVALLTAVAVGATTFYGAPRDVTPETWLTLAVLGLCGAVAHLFPVRSARGGATYTLTNVFLITGAVALPPALLTPLAILALTPERWGRRGRPGLLIGWLFNVSQSAIALHVASLAPHISGPARLSDLQQVGALLLAAALFTITQDVLVGVVIGLQTGTPVFSTPTFTVPALLSDALLAVLGVIVAGLWLTAPALLLVVPPLLIIVFRMTRTAHLAHLAELDAKTGAHNYRHFERALEDELVRCRRVGRPLAVLFADLDHFKQVNDRYGHTVGDRVLVQTASLMSSTLRRSDVVARFGGEEFVALLAGTDVDEAMYLAERVRAAVESHAFTTGTPDAQLRCTVSIGVAAFPHDGPDADTLMQQADAAVYQAKRTRNAIARPSAPVSRSAHVQPRPAVEVAQNTSAGLPLHAEVLLWACVAGGTWVALTSLLSLLSQHTWSAAVPFMVLAVAGEFLGVRIYDTGKDRISFSFGAAATMVAVTALPVAAPAVALLGAVAHLALTRRRDVRRTLFNLANAQLATGAAVWVYQLLWPGTAEFTIVALGAALAAAVAYYVLNSGSVWLMISLSTRQSFSRVLLVSGWTTPINLLLALTGGFLGGAHEQLGLIGTLMFAAPILILRITLDLYARRSRHAIDTLQVLNHQLEAEIAQRKRFEETLEHQALHDTLTDFPNRSFLLARIQELLKRSAQPAEPFALLLLDLDRFKDINDTFGHQYGDLLLQQVGERLRDRLRAGDTIARLGGDEFGVLLPDVGADGATRAARTILAALEQPLMLEGQALEIDASIGIALSPEHGLDPDGLLRRADVAMYIAKRGHTRLAIYDARQDQHSPARLQLVGDLRRAIEGEGLVLNYQPKASFKTGQVVGSEALVRWAHPSRGLLAPDLFIPLAENTGLIRSLSRWVLNDALRQSRVWQDQGLAMSVSVNLSMRDLHDPQLPELVSSLLTRWQVAPSSLKLEITESAVMADAERAIDVLGRLRSMGVQISVDDFGTGYSSLSYLKRLPVDELKIDRSFVHQMSRDERDVAIVRSTIGLAHDLGLTVVAEGVEDRATWDLLARHGCDLIQGYFLSRPLPAEGFADWLRDSDLSQLRAA